MTIAAAVLDFYDDTKHELMTKIAMPQSLASLHVAELSSEQHERLPDTDFGLVIMTKRASVLRKFPVNDPGNAWLSSQYFQRTHEKLAFPARFVAAKFIKSACDAYGVPASNAVSAYATRAADEDDIDNNVFIEGAEHRWLQHKLAQHELLTKQASAAEINAMTDAPNEHYALVMRTGDGAIIRKYAMPDARHVKMAAAYFDKYAMDLPPEHRHRFAVSVRNRADDLGVDVSENDLLEKWASSTWNRHVHAHIEQRKSLLPRNDQARAALDKLAGMLHETTPEDAAQALQTIDQATGLTRYYDKALSDPYASTMGKVAGGWSDEIDDHTITEADLRKLAGSSKLAGYLGSDFARQFDANPVEVFEALPTPEKVLIKQVITGEA